MVEKAANHSPLQIRDALSDEMDEVSAIMLAAFVLVRYASAAGARNPAAWGKLLKTHRLLDTTCRKW